MIVLKVLCEFLLTVIAIDFVTGLVHWAEDTFGTEQTPILGKLLIAPNVEHHEHPAAFTHKTWWQSSWELVVANVLILVVAWATGHLGWQTWVFCILGANANALHKYAHLSKKKTPLPVRFLQSIYLAQSPRHHALHHSGQKNTAYCVITPFVNPVLDKMRFWRILERLLVPLFGAPRREDLNIGKKKA